MKKRSFMKKIRLMFFATTLALLVVLTAAMEEKREQSRKKQEMNKTVESIEVLAPEEDTEPEVTAPTAYMAIEEPSAITEAPAPEPSEPARNEERRRGYFVTEAAERAWLERRPYNREEDPDALPSVGVYEINEYGEEILVPIERRAADRGSKSPSYDPSAIDAMEVFTPPSAYRSAEDFDEWMRYLSEEEIEDFLDGEE